MSATCNEASFWGWTLCWWTSSWLTAFSPFCSSKRMTVVYLKFSSPYFHTPVKHREELKHGGRLCFVCPAASTPVCTMWWIKWRWLHELVLKQKVEAGLLKKKLIREIYMVIKHIALLLKHTVFWEESFNSLCSIAKLFIWCASEGACDI